MKELFKNLIWPAVAGNVAWSFFTIFVEKGVSEPEIIARLLALFFLAIYLGVDWMRMFKSASNLPGHFWVLDIFHTGTVVVFAIAAQQNKDWLTYSLGSIFVVGILGHILGAWGPPEALKAHRGLRKVGMIAVNVLGLAPLLWPNHWALPIGMATMLTSWLVAHYYFQVYGSPYA